jgi:hypothetical protein
MRVTQNIVRSCMIAGGDPAGMMAAGLFRYLPWLRRIPAWLAGFADRPEPAQV